MAYKMTNPTKGTTGGGSAAANKAKNAANQAKNDANAKKVAENKAKVEANRLKVEANKAKILANSKKPAPSTTTSGTKLPMVTVTAKRIIKPVSEDKYMYFGGKKGSTSPTKELTRAEYLKYYNSKDPNMGLTKILKTDTAALSKLERNYGASTIKGYVPLKKQTTPSKKTK